MKRMNQMASHLGGFFSGASLADKVIAGFRALAQGSEPYRRTILLLSSGHGKG
jgi:hypothetical protein